jgi:DNA-binding CsgD family transcriptional regulator
MRERTATLARTLVELSTSSSTLSEYYGSALPVLEKAVGFDNAIVFSPGITDSRPRIHGMCPEERSFVSLFLSDFDRYGVVPTRAAELAVEREVVTDSQVYTDLGIDRTRDPFENEVARPCGITSVLDLAVRLGPTVFGIISLHRAGRSRRFSSRETDILMPIAPLLGVTVAALRTRCEELAFDGLKSRLAPRELQVAALVRRGLSNKEIAMALGNSPNTVRNQLHEIFEKLSIRRRAELMRMVGAGPTRGTRHSEGGD